MSAPDDPFLTNRARLIVLASLILTACTSASRGTVTHAVTPAPGNWSRPESVGTHLRAIASVSCPDTTFCMIVDNSGRVLTYDGSTWQTSAGISPFSSDRPFVSKEVFIACASATFCAAVDVSTWTPCERTGCATGGSTGTHTRSRAYTWDGSNWSGSTLIDYSNNEYQGGTIEALSCADPSFCQAAGRGEGPKGKGRGDASTWNGSRWSAITFVDHKSEGYGPSSVSCPSPSFCMAVDGVGNALAWNGSKWSAAELIDAKGAGYGPLSVSCTSASFCMAVDGAGNWLAWNGSSWSAPAQLGLIVGIKSLVIGLFISCASPASCIAVTSNREAFTWDGSGWSKPVAIEDSSGRRTLTGLSCASPTFCVATDRSGNVLTWR